jgi:hypothetical protein
MRNDEERRVRKRLGDDALERRIRHVVKRRTRLVERNERRALCAEEHAREAEQLPLADGERFAKLGNGRVELALEAVDRVAEADGVNGGPELGVRVGARAERLCRVQI